MRSPTIFHRWLLVLIILSGIFFYIKGTFGEEEKTIPPSQKAVHFSQTKPKTMPTDSIAKALQKSTTPNTTPKKNSTLTDTGTNTSKPRNPSVPPLGLKLPPISNHPWPSGEKLPPEVAEVAAKFHWLTYLTRDQADSRSVLAELKKICKPKLYNEIQTRFDLPPGKQSWKQIDVFPVSAGADGFLVNTIATINGEEYWLFEQVVREGGEWKIEDFYTDLP